MSAYAGSLVPAHAPSVPLFLVPLVLLLGALVLAFFGGRLRAQRSASVALASAGLSLGTLGVDLAKLFSLEPARRALRDVTTNVVRVGSFDANLGFFLDPTAALLLLASLGGLTIVLARTKFVEKNEARAIRFRASTLLLAAGVSTALLADGFVGLLLGLSLATVAIFLLVVRSEGLPAPVFVAHRLFALHAAGSASLVAAFVLLFWALGGKWYEQDGYLADYRARFVAIHAPQRMPEPEPIIMPGDTPLGERDEKAIAQRAKQRGTLTFTSYPGALVFIDAGGKNLDRAEPFGVAPFVRKDIAAGPHDVVIVPGGGAIVTGDGYEVAWIERLEVGENEDVSIVPLGQVTTFSEITDQLGLLDAEGKRFLRTALFRDQLTPSIGVVPLVVLLLALGGFLFSVPVFVVPWLARVAKSPAWNVARIAAVALGIYPLVRLDQLVSFHLGIVAGVFFVGAAIILLVRARRPALLVGAAALFAVLMSAFPCEMQAAELPRILVRPDRGDVVELEYAPDGETMTGAFVIRNDGAVPLRVERVALRGTAEDPRTPPFVSVQIEGSKTDEVVIEPGKERRAIVRWRFGAARARDLFGHVFVESNGDGPRLVAIHASRSRDLGALGPRVLSFLAWFPLVAALLALGLRLVRRDDPRWLAVTSGLVYAVNFIVVLAIAVVFDRSFGRADGNEGFQLVERSLLFPSLGNEYYLGVDGISLTLIIVTSIAALIASLASVSLRDRAAWFHVFAALLVTSVMGVCLSLDLFLFNAFWFVGAIAGVLLVAYRGGERSRRAALRMGLVAFAGALLLGASAYWLHQHADPTYAVDGRYLAKAWSFPDLRRVNWLRPEWTLFGTTAITVIWSALFLAFGSRLFTLPDVFAEKNAPTNVLWPIALTGTAIVGLLRINVGVLPDASKWAATTVMALGVAFILIAAFLARGETDLKRLVARVSTAYAGFALVGIGSLTAQGLTASVYVATTLGVGVPILVLLVEALETRVQSREVHRFGGLAQDMPQFAAMFVLATLALVGLPGLVGFWGPLLSVVGAFPRHRALALGALGAGVVLAVMQMGLAGRILFGAVPAKWRKDKYLEPFGGKFPDLYRGERWAMVPLAMLLVGLGISPRTLFSLLDTVMLDLHRLVDAVGISQVG